MLAINLYQHPLNIIATIYQHLSYREYVVKLWDWVACGLVADKMGRICRFLPHKIPTCSPSPFCKPAPILGLHTPPSLTEAIERRIAYHALSLLTFLERRLTSRDKLPPGEGPRREDLRRAGRAHHSLRSVEKRKRRDAGRDASMAFIPLNC